MYKIGLSSCGKTLCEALLESYHKAGISAMEISVSSKECANIDFGALKLWAEKYGIDLWSFHLPFSSSAGIDISRADTCKATLALHEAIIEKASAIGIKQFVVHPSGEPISDEDRPQRMERSKESLALLAEIAHRNGAVIAVEDLPRTCLGRNSDEILELISVDQRLMVCFDTNHLLAEDPVEFIHKIGSRITTTHVSDYDFIDERHWLPGEGKLDWQAILKALKDVGYHGPWLYELGFTCPETIVRSRDLTCEDFVENAKTLFSAKH